MVDFVESEISSYFSSPESDDKGDHHLVLSGLSSYERLIAHACSAYNSLQSRSFDCIGDGGGRERGVIEMQ
jgi:hypothetical protein